MTDRPTPAEKDLQIEQDLPFQRREMRLSRVAWVVMLLFLLAGLAGLFGSGPLSQTTASAPGDAFWIEYDRIARWQAPTPLHVHLRAGHPSPFATVWIRHSSPEARDVERVDPPPLFAEVHPDSTHYAFYAPDTSSEITITFILQANGWGRREGAVGVPGGPEVPFTRIVLP
jgi:hypothetical protein